MGRHDCAGLSEKHVKKIPGTLRMASKSYFFSEETPKGLLFSFTKTKLY